MAENSVGRNGASRFDVTLAGETNLDIILYGLPEELPVERELLATGRALVLGGSPAITAHNLARLGNSVGFITGFSDDVLGKMCRQRLQNSGVDLSRAVSFSEGPGTGVSIILQHPDTRRLLTYAGGTARLSFADLDLDYLARSRHFHLGSYFLQTALQPDVPRLLAHCRERGLTTSMDSNDDPADAWSRQLFEAFPYLDLFLPNQREACALTRREDPDAALAALADRIPLVVMKRGRSGATARRGSSTWSSPIVDADRVDAVGAGDSFNAGFLHAWVRQWPIENCLRHGNIAGAFSTTAAGGTTAFEANNAAVQDFFTSHAAATKTP